MNVTLYREVVALVGEKVAQLAPSVELKPPVIDACISRVYREVEKDGWPEDRGRYVVKSLARCAVK